MSENFHIYIDQLKNGQEFHLNEEISSSFLDAEEKELQFAPTLHIKAHAYVAETHLVIHFSLKVNAFIPCTICNLLVETPIEIKEEYHLEPLENIPSSIYKPLWLFRDCILLQTPSFTECSQGSCPERGFIKKYLKNAQTSKEAVYHPFEGL